MISRRRTPLMMPVLRRKDDQEKAFRRGKSVNNSRSKANSIYLFTTKQLHHQNLNKAKPYETERNNNGKKKRKEKEMNLTVELDERETQPSIQLKIETEIRFRRELFVFLL